MSDEQPASMGGATSEPAAPAAVASPDTDNSAATDAEAAAAATADASPSPLPDAASSPSDATSSPTVASSTAAASPVTPATPASTGATPLPASSEPEPANLTPAQLRAKKLFDRWQKTFLGAVDRQSDDYIVNMLREGEALVRAGLIDLNRSIKPASGSTFLHTAAWFQRGRVIQWLLSHGADPNQGNQKNNTPLMLLAENAHKEGAPQLIQLMVDHGGDVDQRDAGGQSSVDKAAAVGFDVRSLRFDKFKEVQARKAAEAGSGAGEASATGAAGGSGEQPASDAPPALTDAERAALSDKATLVFRKLSTLFLGLDAEGVSSAVDDAIVRILSSNLALVREGVLDLSAPPLGGDGSGRTLLHLAVAARRVEIVRTLLRMLSDSQVDAQDNAGDTALHLAIAHAEDGSNGEGAAIVSLLLDAGASTTKANYLRGLTPPQMLPSNARPDTKAWLAQLLARPKANPGIKAAREAVAGMAGKLMAGSITAHSSGASTPLRPPSPSSSAERQDRAGARALISRMANAVTGTPGAGAGAAKPSALGLIQKAAGAIIANKRASARDSAGPAFSSALQQLMSNKGAASGTSGAGGPSTASTGAVGVRGAGVATKPKSLPDRPPPLSEVDDLFSLLDHSASGTITPAQLAALHEETHGCCNASSTRTLVASVLESVPGGVATRANLMDLLASLTALCSASEQMRWDWRALDSEEMGSLSTDTPAGGVIPPAQLAWLGGEWGDSSQSKFDDWMQRRSKQEKGVRPRELRWNEMQAELAGKMPTFS